MFVSLPNKNTVPAMNAPPRANTQERSLLQNAPASRAGTVHRFTISHFHEAKTAN